MGDTGDLMAVGMLCQACGAVMPDIVPTDAEFADAAARGERPLAHTAPGYPRTCGGCKRRRRRPKETRHG